MLYLCPIGMDMSDKPEVFGIITAPHRWGVLRGIKQGRPWAFDNSAFSGNFDPVLFFRRLRRHEAYRSTCLFVVCPDVMGNAIATMEKYRSFAWRIKELGWPVAFVAQDGQELFPFPPEYDYLFIGGSTEWKLGEGADECIRRAKRDGKPVHVGRVNTLRRIRHFMMMEVDSIDGTTIAFAPNRELPKIAAAMAQRPIFTLL